MKSICFRVLYMELKEKTESAKTVGRRGYSLKKTLSSADTSRYLLFGRVDVSACSIAVTTGSAVLNPVLQVDLK